MDNHRDLFLDLYLATVRVRVRVRGEGEQVGINSLGLPPSVFEGLGLFSAFFDLGPYYEPCWKRCLVDLSKFISLSLKNIRSEACGIKTWREYNSSPLDENQKTPSDVVGG